jgi:Rrf2 family transcriptional regulator, cysteine metabolism repressor
MILLSRKTDYALLILAYLHTHAEGGSAREISERYELSRGFVANILKELCQKGYVQSHRGVKGGYGLTKTLDQIPVSELFQSMEDGFQLAACTGAFETQGEKVCSVSHHCPVKGPMAELHHRLVEMLRSVSVADLVKVNPTNQPTFQEVLEPRTIHRNVEAVLSN